MIEVIGYQSYQCGIEMLHRHPYRTSVLATNRTNVELKYVILNTSGSCGLTTNRTNVELKSGLKLF